MARRRNSRSFPSSLTKLTSSFSYPSNGSLRSVVFNLPPGPVTSVLGQKQAGAASNEEDRDTKVPVDMPRRSLRRKSGPVSYNLFLAPSVHGPSAGAKMAHEKAMRLRFSGTPLDEVPKPPTSIPLRLLSNGGAEALNLDWEIDDCPGGHASGLPAREKCHHHPGSRMRLETVAYPKGKLKQVLGKRNLDADEEEDNMPARQDGNKASRAGREVSTSSRQASAPGSGQDDAVG